MTAVHPDSKPRPPRLRRRRTLVALGVVVAGLVLGRGEWWPWLARQALQREARDFGVELSLGDVECGEGWDLVLRDARLEDERRGLRVDCPLAHARLGWRRGDLLPRLSPVELSLTDASIDLEDAAPAAPGADASSRPARSLELPALVLRGARGCIDRGGLDLRYRRLDASFRPAEHLDHAFAGTVDVFHVDAELHARGDSTTLDDLRGQLTLREDRWIARDLRARARPRIERLEDESSEGLRSGRLRASLPEGGTLQLAWDHVGPRRRWSGGGDGIDARAWFDSLRDVLELYELPLDRPQLAPVLDGLLRPERALLASDGTHDLRFEMEQGPQGRSWSASSSNRGGRLQGRAWPEPGLVELEDGALCLEIRDEGPGPRVDVRLRDRHWELDASELSWRAEPAELWPAEGRLRLRSRPGARLPALFDDVVPTRGLFVQARLADGLVLVEEAELSATDQTRLHLRGELRFARPRPGEPLSRWSQRVLVHGRGEARAELEWRSLRGRVPPSWTVGAGRIEGRLSLEAEGGRLDGRLEAESLSRAGESLHEISLSGELRWPPDRSLLSAESLHFDAAEVRGSLRALRWPLRGDEAPQWTAHVQGDRDSWLARLVPTAPSPLDEALGEVLDLSAQVEARGEDWRASGTARTAEASIHFDELRIARSLDPTRSGRGIAGRGRVELDRMEDIPSFERAGLSGPAQVEFARSRSTDPWRLRLRCPGADASRLLSPLLPPDLPPLPQRWSEVMLELLQADGGLELVAFELGDDEGSWLKGEGAVDLRDDPRSWTLELEGELHGLPLPRVGPTRLGLHLALGPEGLAVHRLELACQRGEEVRLRGRIGPGDSHAWDGELALALDFVSRRGLGLGDQTMLGALRRGLIGEGRLEGRWSEPRLRLQGSAPPPATSPADLPRASETGHSSDPPHWTASIDAGGAGLTIAGTIATKSHEGEFQGRAARFGPRGPTLLVRLLDHPLELHGSLHGDATFPASWTIDTGSESAARHQLQLSLFGALAEARLSAQATTEGLSFTVEDQPLLRFEDVHGSWTESQEAIVFQELRGRWQGQELRVRGSYDRVRGLRPQLELHGSLPALCLRTADGATLEGRLSFDRIPEAGRSRLELRLDEARFDREWSALPAFLQRWLAEQGAANDAAAALELQLELRPKIGRERWRFEGRLGSLEITTPRD